MKKPNFKFKLGATALAISLGLSTINLNGQGLPSSPLDLNFGENLTMTGVGGLFPQSNGKFLVVGFQALLINDAAFPFFARLNANGTPDSSFDIRTAVTNGPFGQPIRIESVVLQSDDKILIGGRFSGMQTNLVRLNNDGSIDPRFMSRLALQNGLFNPLYVQPDGKIVGFSYAKLIRVNSDGSADPSFIPTATATPIGTIISAVPREDGTTTLVGSFTNINNTSRNRVARLKADGNLDLSFNIGSGADLDVYAIAAQKDGKILVGGRFSRFNGVPRSRICRLNADGSLDAGFDPGNTILQAPVASTSAIFGINILQDGRILVAGRFATGPATNRLNNLLILNSDGSLNFDTQLSLGPDGPVTTIAALPTASDSPVIFGSFTRFNGVPRNGIARLLLSEVSFSPPKFVAQPINQVAVANESTRLSASVTGGLPLGYQWFFNDTPVAGANAPALEFGHVEVAQAGNYVLVASNSWLCCINHLELTRVRTSVDFVSPGV